MCVGSMLLCGSRQLLSLKRWIIWYIGFSVNVNHLRILGVDAEIALPDDCSYARSSFKVALDARFCGVVLDSSGPTVHSGCTSFTSVGLLSHLSLVLLQDHRGGKPKICASGRGQRR